MRQELVGFVVAAVMALTAAQAAEPAQAPVTPEELKSEVATFSSPLEYAKSVKAEAEKGDGRAMYKFAMVLLVFSPDPFKGDQAAQERWREVGMQHHMSRWINAAAKAGYRPAMEDRCRIGQDTQAPQWMQDEGKEWCKKLGQ